MLTQPSSTARVAITAPYKQIKDVYETSGMLSGVEGRQPAVRAAACPPCVL
jgi:hypothetical protein